jgi:hypothetical protein
MLDDATLKRLWASRLPSDDRHPDEATWERLVCDELPAEERTAVLEHVASCGGCARFYRALVQLEDDARAQDPALPGRASGSAPRPWLWGGLAAAAVLVLAARVSWQPLDPGLPAPGTTATTSTRDAHALQRELARLGTDADSPRR